jgi:antitoxin VapB
MQTERHVHLFRNGRNQAIRIPKEFELEGNEAIIRKEGNRLIIEPIEQPNRLIQLLKTLKPIYEDFPNIEDPPFKL